MVLIPRISYGQGDDRFLANTLMNDRFTNTHATFGDGSLLSLAEDKRKNIYVHGHYNRAVMFIDVILSFDTYSEQVNYMSYIHNMIPVNHNKFIRAPLELYIPHDFCYLISKLSKTSMNTDDNVHEFLTYMNTIWHHPITYKLKGGSNSDEYFMYYISDIDTVVQDVQSIEPQKDGQVRKGFNISFTVRCDFNTIGYFTLNSPEITKPINMKYDDDKTITSLFSDNISLNDFVLPIGWQILCWPIFKIKEDEHTVSIDGILNQSLRTVIDHHLQYAIPMDSFIQIQFRENGTILDDEAFDIDWRNKNIVLYKPNHRRTYRLLVTVSPDYINNLIKDSYNLE